jgi:tetratricopeptide (TPR) repeat protein
MAAQLERAIELFRSRDFEPAAEELQALVAADENNWLAQAWLARALLRFDTEEAEVHAELALAIAPNEGFAHFARAEVLAESGHSDEAIEEIKQAIALESTQPDYYALLAEIYYRRTRREEALAAAERGLAIDPQHAGCQDRKTQAINYLEDRLGHRSTDEGTALLREGKYREAAAKFCQALEKNPTRGYVRDSLLMALRRDRSVLGTVLRGLQFLDDWRQIALIPFWIGAVAYMAYAYLSDEDAPAYALLVQGFIAYGVTITLSSDLLDIVLWLHPQGRLSLSPDEAQGAKWLSLCIAVTLLFLLLGILLSAEFSGLAFVFACLIYAVKTIFKCRAGRRRKIMVAVTLLLLPIGIFGIFPLSLLPESWQTENLLTARYWGIRLFVAGILLHVIVLERILTREEV